MTNRKHVCDISLNGTCASVVEAQDQGAVLHEVEIRTGSNDSGNFAYFDFQDVCVTTAAVIEHLRRGCSLESFIAAHRHAPGDTPEITRPQHEHDEDHDIVR